MTEPPDDTPFPAVDACAARARRKVPAAHLRTNDAMVLTALKRYLAIAPDTYGAAIQVLYEVALQHDQNANINDLYDRYGSGDPASALPPLTDAQVIELVAAFLASADNPVKARGSILFQLAFEEEIWAMDGFTTRQVAHAA